VLKEVSKFDNPYLLKIYDYFESANNKYLVLEYCDSGDLQEKMFRSGRISEEDALDIAY
jgi:serine/threonine-protein kinase ULK2